MEILFNDIPMPLSNKEFYRNAIKNGPSDNMYSEEYYDFVLYSGDVLNLKVSNFVKTSVVNASQGNDLVDTFNYTISGVTYLPESTLNQLMQSLGKNRTFTFRIKYDGKELDFGLCRLQYVRCVKHSYVSDDESVWVIAFVNYVDEVFAYSPAATYSTARTVEESIDPRLYVDRPEPWSSKVRFFAGVNFNACGLRPVTKLNVSGNQYRYGGTELININTAVTRLEDINTKYGEHVTSGKILHPDELEIYELPDRPCRVAVAIAPTELGLNPGMVYSNEYIPSEFYPKKYKFKFRKNYDEFNTEDYNAISEFETRVGSFDRTKYDPFSKAQVLFPTRVEAEQFVPAFLKNVASWVSERFRISGLSRWDRPNFDSIVLHGLHPIELNSMFDVTYSIGFLENYSPKTTLSRPTYRISHQPKISYLPDPFDGSGIVVKLNYPDDWKCANGGTLFGLADNVEILVNKVGDTLSSKIGLKNSMSLSSANDSYLSLAAIGNIPDGEYNVEIISPRGKFDPVSQVVTVNRSTGIAEFTYNVPVPPFPRASIVFDLGMNGGTSIVVPNNVLDPTSYGIGTGFWYDIDQFPIDSLYPEGNFKLPITISQTRDGDDVVVGSGVAEFRKTSYTTVETKNVDGEDVKFFRTYYVLNARLNPSGYALPAGVYKVRFGRAPSIPVPNNPQYFWTAFGSPEETIVTVPEVTSWCGDLNRVRVYCNISIGKFFYSDPDDVQ